MSTAVVQATCPRCKKSLRIPLEWVGQSLRCKHCRSLFQSRTRTSAPPPLMHPAPVPEMLAVPVTEPELAPPAVSNPTPIPAPVALMPAPAPIPVAPPGAPLAVPVAPVAPLASPVMPAPEAANPFDPFGQMEEEIIPRHSVRRRSSGRGPWVALGVSVGLLVLVAGGIFLGFKYWPSARPAAPTGVAGGETGKEGTGKTNGTWAATNGAFPRRALIVSVHNYLYANPTNFGQPGISSRNLDTFMGRLSHRAGFGIPPTQIAHLSDAARKRPIAPTKPVIEETIDQFLNTARAQDRIVLFFVGHGVEIDDEAYLAPIEGELTVKETLLPLKWVYDKLAACKARQKVLILDVCRFSPQRGQERPGGDPMGEKFDAALKNPPKGVQVWTACVGGQRSYEFDSDPINNGLFMDCLHEAAGKGVEGKFPKPTDSFPLTQLAEMVNKRMQDELEPLGLKQMSRLSGEEAPEGAEYNPNEAPALTPVAVLPKVGMDKAELRQVQQILYELTVPPVKVAREEGVLRADILPPFPTKVLDQYPLDKSDTPLRKAIIRTQALLWAVSPSEPPKEFKEASVAIKKEGDLNYDLSILREGYRAPADETRFKNELVADGTRVARILRLLEEGLEEMEKVKDERDKAPKRIQATYDFMLARLMNQIAYVYEYQSMLGQMRKELPPRNPKLHGGWRLASQPRLSGDSTGKKLARAAAKLLDQVIKENASTPWEVLAKREKLTALGLEWQPEK